MRSPLRALSRAITNQTPVPYVSRTARSFGLPFGTRRDAEAQLRAMGSVGTLFAIVNRTSNAVAQVDWKLWRKAKSGLDEDRTEVIRHAALDLWNRPNKFMPRQEFVETFSQHLDLTGEGWWVIAGNPRAKIPLELWPVRPDRMEPVPHPEDFLSGYVYCGPAGERVPLGLDEVIQLRTPNPCDPYRGMGPVQSLLADLDGVRYSAEWNRNFFLNSAEPGGIIEVPNALDDREFDELRERWNEQHRGVANAHRVAILEHGKWVDRKFTQRDMQFAELRAVGREVIREAFGMPKGMLGTVDDVNRANAEAGEVMFARYMVVPRLERIKQALNEELLPLFGATAEGLEFDYESPVPEDRELAAKELTSKAEAAAALSAAGWYPADVLTAVGLPEMAYGQPDADPDRELLIDLVKGAPAQLADVLLPLLGIELPERPEPAGPPQPAAESAAILAQARARLALPPIRAEDQHGEPDLEPVRQQHEAALTRLMAEWDGIAEDQYRELEDQIAQAVDDEDPEALAALTVDNTRGTTVLRHALADMATTAARQMANEAAAQGVNVDAPEVDTALTDMLVPRITAAFGSELVDIAAATAALLGAQVAASAAGEALRRYSPGAVGRKVATAVTSSLRKLKNTFRRDQLAGALHRGQNTGRLATLEAAPKATYKASEKNDANRCPPCAEIDGTTFPDLAAAQAVYGAGGYQRCEGGNRCRGTVIAVWNTTTEGGA